MPSQEALNVLTTYRTQRQSELDALDAAILLLTTGFDSDSVRIQQEVADEVPRQLTQINEAHTLALDEKIAEIAQKDGRITELEDEVVELRRLLEEETPE